MYLADLNGDGHDDILIAEVPTKNTDGKSGKFRILQGKADGFDNNQAGAADYQQFPFTIYDKNGDGWLDVCAAGGEKSQRCQLNDKSTGNIDGTGWGTNDGTHDVRGNCATAKYAGVALDEGMTVGQLVADPCAGDTLNQLELFVHDNYITDLSTSSRRRLRRFLLSSTTNSVTDAVWADFDGDGIKELAILTDDGSGNNELFIMSVEETESISYTTTTGLNHDTSVTAAMSTHTTEAAAKTACDSARLEPGQAVFSTGLDFSCQVLRDRTVKCMGSNLHGALGDPDEVGSHACVAITPYLADVTNVQSISAGDHFACAVIVGGTVKCWGKNDKGQCGLGDTNDPKKTPTAVSITNVRQISTGYDVACAVLTDNTVKCWGSNAGGAAYTASNTGDHAIEDEPIVVDAALTDVSFVSCGGANTNDMGSHCCALKTNGAVICWGNGAGLGSSITNSPHDLTTYLDGSSNGNKAIWVTAGGDQVCVVKHDKSVWCLGDNKQGAVGNNGADDAYDSLQDTGLRKVSKVECHINHCCALKEDKTIWCWGWSTCKDQATCDNDEDGNDVDFDFHKGDQPLAGNLWGSGVSGGWKVPTETAWSGAIDIFVSTVHLCFRQENNEIRCYGSEDDERNCNPQVIGLDLSWCDHCACGGYQYTLAKQWEVVPSPISYKSTPAQAMTESCRNSETGSYDDKVSYFPKSCNDLAKDDDQLWCMAFDDDDTESGLYRDYVAGADLGAAEPSSLDDVGTECQFDSEVDVKDSAKLDVCFTTANNWYAQQCKLTTDCAGFNVRWGGTATNVDPEDHTKDDIKDNEFWHRGFKKFGDKYVPVTTNLKVSTATSYPYNGCYDNWTPLRVYADYWYIYKVEGTTVTPVLNSKTISMVASAGELEKVGNFDSSAGGKLTAVDAENTGTPQLLISGPDGTANTTFSYKIDMEDVANSGEGTKLSTAVPGSDTIDIGFISESTFTAGSLTGVTIRGVPDQNDVTISSSRLNLPVSCDVNQRTVNGVCEACPPGSTSTGVVDPAATPNTGCTKSICGVNEYVKDTKCFACIAPETNVAGDDTTQGDTECDCVDSWDACINSNQVYTGTCEGGEDASCDAATGGSTECKGSFSSCDSNGDKTWINHIIPSDGNLTGCVHQSGHKEACVCNGVKYASGGLCYDCPTGATANLNNYNPQDGDTVCLCQGEMASDGSICSECPPGKTNNLKDYNPTSGVSECTGTFCAKDEHVVNHICVACAYNSQRLKGDDPAGPDTQCHCKVNSKVIGGDCKACEDGSTNPKLCYASKEGGDTYCTCNENYHADANKVCQSCPSNSKNEAGDYGGDGPTYCHCRAGSHVVSGACQICPDFSGNGGGNELDGGDTFCQCNSGYFVSSGVCTECPPNTYNDAPTRTNVEGKCKCNQNFKVVSNECVACELTSTRQGGSLMSGSDTYCVCGTDEKVQSNLCVDCEEGSTRNSGDDSAGADTECTCLSNFHKVGGVCTSCPIGTTSAGGDNDCVCKAGYYVKTVGTCELCPIGSTADGGNDYNVLSTCKLNAGYYVDGSGDVHACLEGSTSSGGELINGGETKCKTTANHFVDTNGDIQDCPGNSAVEGGVVVEPRATISGCICNKGYQEAASSCGQCPEGQTTDGTHRTNEAQRDCYCKERYFVDPTETQKCQLCSEGGSIAEGGDPNGIATSCACAADYRVDANGDCVACNPGETNAPFDRFTDNDGPTDCDITKCLANQRVENNACVSCPTGMINEKDDPANDVNTICDYQGDTEDQYEFDVSGSQFLVQKKDGTNLGLNPTIDLRIGTGPFIFSRQPASTAGDDLVLSNAVVWTTQDTDYASFTPLASFIAKDDVSVIVWNPNLPGTYYYLSQDTSTMVGKIEVSLPLCIIPSSGTVTLTSSCILPSEITLTGDLEITVVSRRRLRKTLKSGQVLIQAPANNRHFSVPAGKTLTIKGLTLSEGNPGDAGGSILVSGGSVVVEDVTFKNNVATTGGAIETEKDQANNEPSVSVKSSTFDNNEGSNGGGAINAKAGSVNVETSTFKNNKATSGDGGAIAAVTDITITGGDFESNTAAAGNGGAISVEGKLLTMEAVSLKSNSAQNGGAVGLKQGTADFKTLTVESNTASAEGGAILVDESDVTIASSQLRSNNGQKGGGIKAKNMGGKKIDAKSNTFIQNSGSDGGGAFHFEDEDNTDILIFGSTFSGNKGVGDENDDVKATGDTHITVKVVDILSEIIKQGFSFATCGSVDCDHRAKSAGKIKLDGSCRCACDGTNEYERSSVCTAITVCGPGDVTVINATDISDRICGSPTVAQKQASFDAAGAALSTLVTNKLKAAGLGDSDAFNLAVDMVGGVNKC